MFYALPEHKHAELFSKVRTNFKITLGVCPAPASLYDKFKLKKTKTRRGWERRGNIKLQDNLQQTWRNLWRNSIKVALIDAA